MMRTKKGLGNEYRRQWQTQEFTKEGSKAKTTLISVKALPICYGRVKTAGRVIYAFMIHVNWQLHKAVDHWGAGLACAPLLLD